MNKIVKELYDYLKHEDTLVRIKRDVCDNTDTLPDENDMNLNKAIARDLIKGILFRETARWEDATNKFQTAKIMIVKELKEEFEVLGNKLAEIEREMKGVNRYAPEIASSAAIRNTTLSIEHIFTDTEKVVIGLTSPLWLPLLVVAATLMAPFVGTYTLYNRLFARIRLHKFRQDRQRSMERWLTRMINNLKEDGIRRDIVADHMTDVVAFIRQFEQKIPELIASSEALIARAHDESAKTDEILKQYDPLRLKLDATYGQRNLYYYDHILPNEADVHTSRDVVNDWLYLASGTFADVYSGFMDGRSVAVKVFKESVDLNSVTDMILERKLLR